MRKFISLLIFMGGCYLVSKNSDPRVLLGIVLMMWGNNVDYVRKDDAR